MAQEAFETVAGSFDVDKRFRRKHARAVAGHLCDACKAATGGCPGDGQPSNCRFSPGRLTEQEWQAFCVEIGRWTFDVAFDRRAEIKSCWARGRTPKETEAPTSIPAQYLSESMINAIADKLREIA